MSVVPTPPTPLKITSSKDKAQHTLIDALDHPLKTQYLARNVFQNSFYNQTQVAHS